MSSPMEKVKGHPGIYRRGSKYVFSIRIDGKQKWESFDTLLQARTAKRAREAARDAGTLVALSNETVAEYADQWCTTYVGRTRRGFREATRAEYRRQIETYLLTFLPKSRKLRDVRPTEMREFVTWLCDEDKQGRRLSDGTVERIMAPVRAMFATAFEDEKIGRDPTRGVRLPNREAAEAVEDDPRKAMTREELERFLEAVDAPWRPFFDLLAVTGVRISEAVGLQWGDVTVTGDPTIQVRRRIVKGHSGAPKSVHSARTIPIPAGLALDLIDMRRQTEWPQDTDPVFPNTVGNPLNPSHVFGGVLKPTANEVGLGWIGFHTFRHTCASMLIADRRNVLQVSRWLGHHSPAFTLTQYGHLMDEGVGAPLALQSVNTVQTGPTPLSTTTAEVAQQHIAV